MFERTKRYLEEHPKVKKALIITGKVVGGVAASAAAGFTAYKVANFVATKKYREINRKIDDDVKKHYENEAQIQDEVKKVMDIWEDRKKYKYDLPVQPEFTEFRRADIPLVQDDHTFDMMFKDTQTGDSYTAKDSCLGSYVNDMLQSFEDTEIEISVDKALTMPENV